MLSGKWGTQDSVLREQFNAASYVSDLMLRSTREIYDTSAKTPWTMPSKVGTGVTLRWGMARKAMKTISWLDIFARTVG